jgi:16S rRNA processing protein RimM
MNKDECFYFGYIAKPVGYEGYFAVKAETDDLQRYNNLSSIFIDLNGTLTPFFIVSAQVKDKDIIWLKAEGFNSKDDIQNLIKKEVFLPLNLLPELKGNKFYYHEIVGFEVHDQNHGNIGTIKDVVELPHQTILQIMQGYTEILVPLNNEILIALERDNKLLKINAPEGLIDIYLNNKNEKDEND